MHCTIINQYINNEISGEEFDQHLENCEYCRDLNAKSLRIFDILDIKADVPKNLAENIILKHRETNEKKTFKIDFSLITQIAAVIAAGIFLGIVLGKNSDTNLLLSKELKKQNSLVEFRNSHHFNTSTHLFQ